MSYLDSPRLHFTGWFQADVSTINNDVRFYQNASFVPEYQQLNQNGSWNPEGTAIYRLVDCSITGAFLKGRQLTAPSDDPIIGMTLQNAIDRAPGKLVDLDPQQQAVSEIWGMQVRLVNTGLQTLFQGEFKPAAFINLWKRQQTAALRDQTLAAVYQSVLEGVTWPAASDSPFIDALRQATQDDLLSIEFNVYGYGRDSTTPRYTMGHITGSIGPYLRGEPKHFVAGRQFLMATGPNPTVPTAGMGNAQAKLAADGNSLTIDLGNSFPIQDANSPIQDIGQVFLGILADNPDTLQQTVLPDQVVLLGEVPYQTQDWYSQTAGVVTFDLSTNPAARQHVQNHPLVVMSQIPNNVTGYNVRLQETIDGVYVRADGYVFRLDPGSHDTVDFYATRFGAPLPGAVIQCAVNNNGMGGSGGGKTVSPPTRPPATIPLVGVPAGVIQYAATITTGTNGYAPLPVSAAAAGPLTPRGYISGQLYGIGYQLQNQPENYISSPFNFVSVLIFTKKAVPAHPTWYADIQQIFTQYGNLYPIMGRYVVNLADYESVVQRVPMLKLAFSLPRHDPNHMPVTRDLGSGDRDTILKWLDSKGADGRPLLGTPAQIPPPIAPITDQNAPQVEIAPSQAAGKSAFILQLEQRRKLAKPAQGESK